MEEDVIKMFNPLSLELHDADTIWDKFTCQNIYSRVFNVMIRNATCCMFYLKEKKKRTKKSSSSFSFGPEFEKIGYELSKWKDDDRMWSFF